MRLLLSIFATDLLPVFLVAGVGFLLARYLGVSVKMLSKVAFNALAPCLVFSTLVTAQIDGRQFGEMALFCVLAMTAMGLAGRGAAALLGLDRPMVSGLLLVVMFSNGGNYGLPVVLFAFGRDALSHATVYFVTSAVLAYTLGVLVAASGHRSFRQAAIGITRVPAAYGFAAAVLVLAGGVTVPLPLMRPVTMLSDAALPVMMLVLGMQLERATMPERPRVVAVAGLLCLVVAPIVALSLTWVLGLEGPARQAAVVQASMPAAVVTTVLALEFEVAPAFVTSVVFSTTILSPLTLAPLIAYLQAA
ncbi:MAG: AEC family transporter [Gemmatimonadetes bacterium]|nr:AEC family transporter [Gemmatimonadota bacterium]